MNDTLLKIVENSIYFLALLNPASKILFLSSYTPPMNFKQIFELSWKSTVVAFGILVTFTIIGQFVLKEIFRLDLYSLKIVGGLVLFFIGWTAVRKGVFFQKEEHSPNESLNEISIVPLAAPLIAGPGTITAAISFGVEFGELNCLIALTIALLINFILMLFSLGINRILGWLYLTGPLIRITGLIVAAVAVQMILAGTGEWLGTIFPK